MVNNDKQKLLCLLKILWTRTDRQHILNSQDLIRILQDDYQCSCDRRTVYSNIDALIHAGFKIKQVKDVFKFPGTLIFQLLYSSPLLKYNDAVNDLDAFSALRYSVRGPKLANWAPWRVISLYKTT